MYQTSSSSVPEQVASAEPVAPVVFTVTLAQVPSVGIVGKATAPAQLSFAGGGGGTLKHIEKLEVTPDP